MSIKYFLGKKTHTTCTFQDVTAVIFSNSGYIDGVFRGYIDGFHDISSRETVLAMNMMYTYTQTP